MWASPALFVRFQLNWERNEPWLSTLLGSDLILLSPKLTLTVTDSQFQPALTHPETSEASHGLPSLLYLPDPLYPDPEAS